MELGLDLEIVEGHNLDDMLKNAAPWAAVVHQVPAEHLGGGLLRWPWDAGHASSNEAPVWC